MSTQMTPTGRTACAWSPTTCRTSRRSRSAYGSASGARHEQRVASTASRICSSTWRSRAPTRRSASDIAEEIEAVGGELNAATSLETTAYYARVLKADVGLALDILADILQIPRYAEDELEREREVILQEIAATRDSPDEIAYELLQDAAFPDQAIGRPILGTTESVKGFRAADLRTFLKANYGASAHGAFGGRQCRPRRAGAPR